MIYGNSIIFEKRQLGKILLQKTLLKELSFVSFDLFSYKIMLFIIRYDLYLQISQNSQMFFSRIFKRKSFFIFMFFQKQEFCHSIFL